MSLRWACAAAALLVAGCSTRHLGEIDAASLGTERVLAVVVDAADRPTRLLGPWRLDAPLAPIALGDSELAMLLVGLSDARFREQAVAFDPAAPLLARLGTACDGTLDGRTQRDLLLAADAPVVRVTPEDGVVERGARAGVTALDGVVLRGAIDPARCQRAGEGAPVAFGDQRRLFDDAVTAEGQSASAALPGWTSAVARLDRDRLVVARDRGLFLVRRGQPYRDAPGQALLLPSTDDAQALGMVVDAAGALVVVGGGTSSGAIWTVPLGPDGFGAVVTATRTDVPLTAVALGGDGAVIGVGYDGWVFVRRPGATTFEATARLGPDLLSVTTTPDLRWPHVLGSGDAQVFVGDARAGTFAEESLTDGGRRIDVEAVAWTGAPGAVALWAGTELGVYHRPVDGEWGQYRLALPPALDRCAGVPDACGARDVVDRLTGMAVDRRAPGGRLWIQPLGCGAHVVLSPSDGCVGHLDRGVGGVVRVDARPFSRALVVDDGLLTQVTEDGEVLELELAP